MRHYALFVSCLIQLVKGATTGEHEMSDGDINDPKNIDPSVGGTLF
jgi:hypothetical protein